MGKKSGPAAPPAPDPMVTAQAQIGVNRDAAVTQAELNRINQSTPQGDLTYSITGKNPDGTPIYSSTQTYSPSEQAKYDQNNRVAIALNGLAEQNIGRVADAQSTPFTYAGMTPLQTNVNGGNPFRLQSGPGAAPVQIGVPQGPIQNYIQTGGIQDTISPRDAQTGIQGAGTAQSIDPNAAGRGIQSSLNYNGLTQLPGTTDFGAEGQRMANSVYSQAASRLDPRFQQSQSDLDAKLAAQGITENSDAYRRDQTQLSQDRNDAYNQAVYSAQQAGATEQSRLFGLAMGARQQGQQEVDAQGQFVNTAQAQNFGQQLSAADQAAQVQNQNVQQRFSEAGLYNAAQGQIFGQQASAADLYNTAQQQAFGQRAAQADLYNTAQNQQFTQGTSNAQLYNAAQNQQFTQGQAAAAENNTAQNQYYNQSSGSATFNNAARQQQIQEAAYLRNLPLNDIASLLSGNQAQAPSFSPVPQVGVASADYQGIVQSNYQAALQQQQQQQAARSQMLGSIFGGIGAIGGAAVGLSDARFKENIKRIGELYNGITTYAFNYLGMRYSGLGY